ncbi:hypothetical protein [Paenibacillus tengchongensis]|uniref:hypothetical protein n=1 Tax=Paenibacillus tengchongensis TaxID=2608684 RepID=UPI00124EB990|nr:hypothetical protein [Paenibacillus tengchongensis]
MTTTLFSREITYGKEAVAELERAAIRVQLLYDRTLAMLHRHLPDSLWDSWIGVPYDIISSLYKGDNSGGTVFQKWIQSPSGWKCIGCERHCLEADPAAEEGARKRRYVFHNGFRQSMVLQAVIWSLYENTLLFHPVLREDSFLDADDLELVSSYFVPTYLTDRPLRESGRISKEYREQNIRVYQEWISAPDLELHWNGGLTEGRWMTGVYMNESRFAGLGPYLKDAQGKRTYMKAMVQ